MSLTRNTHRRTTDTDNPERAMSFSEEELAYIRSQRLARVATVAADGQPDLVPVGFEFDGTHFYIGGFDPGRTRRSRNVRAGNEKVALVIDDLASIEPFAPRFLRIYGTAELVERDTQFGKQPILKITPTISWSENLDGRPITEMSGNGPRRTVHGQSR
jgi:pyridoxamine 5'-phosphate oxidase family protein